jgi:peroxiredoxin Q/BCP
LPRPNVGEHAPDFTLPNAQGKPVRLGELLARKIVVLFFYPKDETAGCTLEACTFRDRYESFTAAGAEVVGVSRDDPASHARFAAHHKLPFTLLSDVDGTVHGVYGVQTRLGFLRDRVTFVIDRAGIVRKVFTSMIDMRGHVESSLPVVRELLGHPEGTSG